MLPINSISHDRLWISHKIYSMAPGTIILALLILVIGIEND